MPRPNADNPMHIVLSDERRAGLLRLLMEFYVEEFDEDLSEFRAERLMSFFLAQLAPPVYNQAIAHAHSFMLEKLDDLDAVFHEPEA